MHRYHYMLLILALVGIASPALARDCERGATNMAQIRACESDSLDRDLTESYRLTRTFVYSKDPAAAKLLDTAQTKWRDFADASCEYSIASRQTAAMENDARLHCWSLFVAARIKVLSAYRSDFGKTGW